MRFSYNDDQLSLWDATKDFFAHKVTSEKIRASFTTGQGYDFELYKSMCEDLGLSALIVSDEYGGFGAGDVEAGIVAFHHGYYLAATPLRQHLSALMVLDECFNDQQKQSFFPQLSQGEKLIGVVFDESDFTLTFDDQHRSIKAGRFARVPFGASLDFLYFKASVKGVDCLFKLDCKDASVNQNLTPSIDQTQILGSIECTDAPVELVCEDISPEFERGKARSVILACNEMVGSMTAILDMAVAYAKDRKQFGRPIGSFQAIKHMLAQMLLETESAKSISMYGSWLASMDSDFVSDDLEDDLIHIASMAKYYCSKALSKAAGENIQIHGGIGFTMEHDAQLYFKRAAFMNAHLGLPSQHAKVLAGKIF